MKTTNIDVLYGLFNVDFSVPSTIQEGDDLMGETGAVLDGFIADTVYRNTLPRFYKTVAGKLIEANLGTKAETDKKIVKADKTETAVLESDIVFIERVYNAGDEVVKEQIADILRSTATSIKFYEAGQRGGGGGKVSKAAQDAANNFFAQGTDRVEAVISKIESSVPGYKVSRGSDGQPTVDSVARAVQAFNKHLEAEAKKQAESALAGV